VASGNSGNGVGDRDLEERLTVGKPIAGRVVSGEVDGTGADKSRSGVGGITFTAGGMSEEVEEGGAAIGTSAVEPFAGVPSAVSSPVVDVR
jgi:hypothetical protein